MNTRFNAPTSTGLICKRSKIAATAESSPFRTVASVTSRLLRNLSEKAFVLVSWMFAFALLLITLVVVGFPAALLSLSGIRTSRASSSKSGSKNYSKVDFALPLPIPGRPQPVRLVPTSLENSILGDCTSLDDEQFAQALKELYAADDAGADEWFSINGIGNSEPVSTEKDRKLVAHVRFPRERIH